MKRGRPKDAALDQRIGYCIFKERERRGLTVMVLARRAGVHRNTISRVESGGGISVCALVRIAAAMEVGWDELLARAQFIVRCDEEDAQAQGKSVTVICGTESLLLSSAERKACSATPDPAPARPEGSPIPER
ncbi:MAG TPA: helix-turn-helix transcriptional regulator [Terracidiphilus sp.]|nr:helix-turn-helix transcriptional regulator [Terracidiphilus sp.]